MTHPLKTVHSNLAVALALLLSPFLMLQPAHAADKGTKPAVAAMGKWLAVIDQGGYADSWSDASDFFQKAVTAKQWTSDLKEAREPLGKCMSRKLASAMTQTDVPMPQGGVMKGHYVIAQFDTSFENMKYAVETVTFKKDTDGKWKAVGYYVKPGS